MADYDVVVNTAGVHIAGLTRGNVVFGVGVPGLLSVIIIVLILIGLLLTGIAVWMLRTTEPESVTLGPLSVMGRKRWRAADPDTQLRELEAARPVGAEGVRSASRSSGGETSDRDSDAAADDLDRERSGDVTRAQKAVTRKSSARESKRTPKRYLAGDEPSERTGSDDGGRGGDDDTRAELGRLAESGLIDFDDDGDREGRSHESDLWGVETLSPDNEADMVALANGSVADSADDWDRGDDVDHDDRDHDDDEGADGAGPARSGGRRSSRAVFRARRRPAVASQGRYDDGDDETGPDPEFDGDEYDDYIDDRYEEGYDDDRFEDGYAVGDYADRYADDGYGDAEYDDDSSTDRDRGVGRRRFELGEYDPYDEAMGLTPEPPTTRGSRRITATRRRRGGEYDDRPAAGPRAHLDDGVGSGNYDDIPTDDNDYDDVEHDHESIDHESIDHESMDMEYQQDNYDDRAGSASDPFFDDDFDGSWDEARPTGRSKGDGARRSPAESSAAAADDSPVDAPAARGRGRRAGTPSPSRRSDRSPSAGMTSFDPEALVDRFRERAAAVRRRPLPPVAGEERQEFIRQAKIDYQDFAMIGDAEVSIEDGVLVMRVDLRGQG